MEQYYTPSGKTSPIAYLYFILAALVALPILATIYAYAIWYIPIPYINFIITAGFGLLIGLAVSFLVIRLGKVRSGLWAFIFSLFGALIALYIHWAVWVDLAINITDTIGTDRIGIATSNIKISQVISLILDPKLLFSIMSEINEVGLWGIRGATISGGFLSFIWIVELLLATVIATLVGIGQSSKPFCEEENMWFEESDAPTTAHFADVPSLIKAMATGDIDSLSKMISPAGDIKVDNHAKISLFDAASGENYVSITNEIAKKNDKDEVSFNSETVVDFLKVNQEVMDKLKGISKLD